MRKLKEVLDEARQKKIAVGHFNFSDLAGFLAITQSALELGTPIMFGLSEGERDFVGIRNAAALIRNLREEYGLEAYLNADHTHHLEKLETAVKAGCDEVIFDLSKEPLEKNIELTKKAVEAAKSINPDVLVEGEIGYIGSSSAILSGVPEGAAITPDMLTTAEEAKKFVEETKIDILAPAVGNMHGMLASMVYPEPGRGVEGFTPSRVEGPRYKELNIDRIKEIAAATSAYLTLHGGSGTSDEGFAAAIKAGITIVHVNTEIRLAWRNGVQSGLSKDPNEVTPYKILTPALEGIREVVEKRLKLFNQA